MNQTEIVILAALVAIVAYQAGRKSAGRATAAAPAEADPMGWLTNWSAV